MKKLIIVFGGMILISVAFWGSVFLIVGTFVISNGNRLEKNCTVEAVGTVVEINVETYSNSDGGFDYIYFPIIEYNVGERIVKKRGSDGSNPSKYVVNDRVEILYNPNNVEEFIVKGYKSPNLWGTVLIVLGALALVFVIGTIMKLIKYNNHNKDKDREEPIKTFNNFK